MGRKAGKGTKAANQGPSTTGRARRRLARSQRAVPGVDAGTAGPWSLRWAFYVVLALIVATPFVFDPASRDAFRLPKALFAQTLVLISLFLLAFGWRDGEAYRRLLRAPAVRAFAPFVLFATAVSLASDHPQHVARAIVGFWIGALALWGWSVGFRREQLSRALRWMTAPAAALSVVAALQFHDLFQPFRFESLEEASRLAITSFAGNAGDLAAFLVLPALVAQRSLIPGGLGTIGGVRGSRVWPAVAVALAFYGIAITQTFAAIFALALGSVFLWWPVLPARRRIYTLAALVTTLMLALAASTPLRERAVNKTAELLSGNWNAVLTGRLDGWRGGLWMLAENPWSGVGLGAYRAEFIHAKSELLDRGVTFFFEQGNVVFANAHNEVIETGAELGLGGLFLLGWAIVETIRRCRTFVEPAAGTAGAARAKAAEGANVAEPGAKEDRARAADRGFAWAAIVSLAALSLFHFPFRIALVSTQAILVLAWLHSAPSKEGLVGARGAAGERG